MKAASIIAIVLHLAVAVAIADDAATTSAASFSVATTDENGFLVHQIESPYEAGTTQVRVLLPDGFSPQARYKVIYVLPVESGSESRYGNGLLEVKRHELHKKHPTIFVAPTFSHTPWFADHPTDPTIRQETYFLKVVLPAVEKAYPAIAAPEGRLLLGFSKSGWGAWTLLLRHPDVFGRAAAWDSPMQMDKPDFGSQAIFGTQENFERYQVSKLLREKAAALGASKRLILTGYGGFAKGHETTHAQLEELKIPHEYRDGPERKHEWSSGWVSEAVELLMD